MTVRTAADEIRTAAPAPDAAPPARDEFRRYWTLVMACAVGFAFSAVMVASTGLFMEPIGREFGWSRVLLSSGLSIATTLGLFTSPLFGMLIDRWGTRRMALAGIVTTALSIAAFGLLSGSPVQWLGLWVIYSLTGSMIKSTVWNAAITSVFSAGRGLALGFSLSGAAMGQAIIPPIANHLIDVVGWRMAFVWLGLGGGAIALAVCATFLFDGYHAAEKQRRDDPTLARPLLDVPGLSLAQAWRSAALWRIGISTFIIMIVTIALLVHQVPILTAAGVDRTSAAYYAGLAGIAGIAGKIATGWLLDRYHVRWIGSLTLSVTALAFVLLLLPTQHPAIIVSAMIISGYSAGTKLQIASFLTAVYGGLRHFGAIFGAISSLIGLGSGLGPLVGGIVYDSYGSYGPFLVFGVFGSLVSAVLIYGVGDYPAWARRPSRSRARLAP